MSEQPPAAAPPPPQLYGEYPDAGPPAGLRVGVSASLTRGPLRPAIVRLALPAVGTTLFQVLFNITDTFWVGRTLGPTALAAVAVSSYTIWIMTSIGELLGVGLAAVASRRHGEGAPAAAARATGTALWMALALGLVVGGAGVAALPAIFELMEVSGALAEIGREFLVIQLLGAPLVYGYFAVAASFRSAGDTRTPFVLLGVSVLLNLALDPALILGWGPLPVLGVYGAALATVLTRALAFIAGFWLLVRRGAVRPAFQPRVARTIATVGLPTTLTGVLFSLIYMFLARVTGGFGAAALAALGVGHKIEGASYMCTIGFGLAAEAVVGQNLGAGEPARARHAGWLTARIAAVPASTLAAVFLLAPAPLVRIFTDDPAVIAAAVLYLRTAALAQLFIAYETVLESALGGAGYTLWPAVWTTALNLSRIPLAAWAAARFGLIGVWWTLSVTAVGRGLVMAAMWRWGAWEHRRV
ncbi:MAG TPA: MATE family efflux transporter [Gemmatimonadales bacterium]|nr:MATE family efflux transporter [Gemmatimonadales bacterium]